MAKPNIPAAERRARTATLETLFAARVQLVAGSVEEIFLYHAGHHCLAQWLSDSWGYDVRITGVTEDGFEVTRVG